MLGSVITAVAIVGLLTFMLATLLIFASRKLYVAENVLLTQVEEMLPHNNCGACGFPSCHMFAEALVDNEALPAKCSVSSEQDKDAIAIFLNVDKGQQVKQAARLACAGGKNVATVQAEYLGLQTCSAAAQVAGGGKTCFWGCLGLADCAKACTFNAIKMDDNGLPVVDESKCTACGDCVLACPKDLFSVKPVDQHLWVACNNLEQGDEILNQCHVACTACGRCALDAPRGLITMENNLPHIHYEQGAGVSIVNSESMDNRKSIDRCPTGAIVWFDASGKAQRGASARHIARHAPLPAEES
jgi:electron transport complex protein RnfB